MAFNTKINLSDSKVYQDNGEALSLSGDTTIATVGDLRYQTHPTFTGDTQVIDKKYVDDNLISGLTACTTYSLESPAAVEVGGITVGTVLTGKTSNCLLEEILVPELYQTSVGTPSTSISASCTGIKEIACSISQEITPNYNAGAITPLYCTDNGTTRGGAWNAYSYTGPSLSEGYSGCTSCVINPYVVTISTQTWNVCTKYDEGACVKGSKGTVNPSYPTVCAQDSNTPASSNASINGVYPVWGTSSSITVLTKQSLVSMTTNCVTVGMVVETGGNKQKFEVACSWLASPTNRPLVAVEQWNTVSSAWECPGGSAAASLALWDKTAETENVQSISVGYCQYTHNSTDRDAVTIRLKFA